MTRFLLALYLSFVSATIPSELRRMPGHTVENHYHSPLPHTYIAEDELPDNFNWANVNGTSYLTRSLNQHVPQWCGSCWAHGALSSLADRIKIDRGGRGPDIGLSIQYVLNCGSHVAGSCLGGSHAGVYQFIFESGFVPYDTCQPYLACSADSDHGMCPHVNTTCSRFNTCRTCEMKLVPSLHPFGQVCREIDLFPNATIAEFGVIRLGPGSVHQTKAELWARGPVAAAINGVALHDYHGGIFNDESASNQTTHIVELVGWETDPTTRQQAWIGRNSWGQYWGEMGFFRVAMGRNLIGIEHRIAWATPGTYTEHNFPCFESGKNCGPTRFVDPSQKLAEVKRRLQEAGR